MMNILVVGGAGYIGSHTVNALLASNIGVPIVFDNLSTGSRKSLPEDVIFIEGDLRNESDIQNVFNKYSIDIVLHFAASIVISESVANPIKYYENNVLASITLLKVMLQNKVKKLIFSSSAAIYGEPKTMLIDEESPTIPNNPYGNSKLIIESILKDISVAYDFSYISLRYFNAAGVHPSAKVYNDTTHLITNVVEAAIGKKKELIIYGDDYPTPDGTCVRDYVHVNDLCDAHILSIKALCSGMKSDVFNLGSSNGYSVKEIVQIAENISGEKIKVKVAPRRNCDSAKLIANSKKAKDILNWTAKIKINEIIADVTNKLRENK